jgi:hypothetical protein
VFPPQAKGLCCEKRVMMYDVISASVKDYETKHSNGTLETVYIICIKHSGGIFEYMDISLSNTRWRDNATALCDAVNKLVASRPF